MKRFSHPHVLGLIGVCVDAGPAPYIISSYMEYGSMLSYLRAERSVLVVKDDTDVEEVNCVHSFVYTICMVSCIEHNSEQQCTLCVLGSDSCMLCFLYIVESVQ